MEDWTKELLIGITLVIVGLFLTANYLGKVIEVVLGVAGPLLLILGAIFLWIGIEDKKLEKEIKELEKELEKEETEEKKKEEQQS